MKLLGRPGDESPQRTLTSILAVRTLAVGLLDFVLLWVVAPNLVDQHQDLALVGAIVCALLAFVVTGWWGLRLWSDLSRRRRRLPPPDSRTIED
jgi:hypothetical protein